MNNRAERMVFENDEMICLRVVEKLVSDGIQEQISKGSINLSISVIASHQQDPIFQNKNKSTKHTAS